MQIFSWRSVEDVQTIIIPFLEGVMEIEQAIVDDLSNPNQTARAESRTKVAQLTEAKKGWQGLLDRNWKLYQDARAGKMAKNAVTHLVADALLQDDNSVDNVKYINGTKAPNADKLREISAIRYLLQLGYLQKHSSLLCLFVTVSEEWGQSLPTLTPWRKRQLM
jgi:hypothetical protein